MLMKKVLLTFFMVVTAAIAVAQTKNYIDDLVVTVNGKTSPAQETTIIVEQNNDGTYTLSLNKLILTDDEGVMPVGNIVLTNVNVTESNGTKSFQVNQNITITAGDDEGFWLGPMLGEVPVNLTGKMNDEHLYCSIDITMSEKKVNVVFGDESKVTSIENITIENSASAIYDLTGRKVEEITTAGIYIVNGKKVLVK